MFAFEFVYQAVVMPDAEHRPRDEINAQHDKAKIQQRQRHQPDQDFMDFVGFGSGDQHAQHGKREDKDRNARAHRGQGRAFFGEQQLDLVEHRAVHLRFRFDRLAHSLD